MNEVIKGDDLIFYVVIGGVKKAICTTKDCKLNISGDLLETTTKNSKRGKTFQYQGKYNYSLTANGLTSLINVTPPNATFKGSAIESTSPTLDAASQLKVNAVVIDDLFGTGSTPLRNANYGLPYSLQFYVQTASGQANGVLIGALKKDNVIIYRVTIPMSDTAPRTYNGIVQPGSKYEYDWISQINANPPTDISTPDNNTVFATTGLNIFEFQQAVLQGIKIQFEFSGNGIVKYTGTVLVPSIDIDSPDNAVSSFNTTLQGDGELTVVDTGGLPPVTTGFVTIKDQTGAVVAIVPDGDTYNVLVFDEIDEGMAVKLVSDLIIMEA